jgi:hypothetical protein
LISLFVEKRTACWQIFSFSTNENIFEFENMLSRWMRNADEKFVVDFMNLHDHKIQFASMKREIRFQFFLRSRFENAWMCLVDNAEKRSTPIPPIFRKQKVVVF